MVINETTMPPCKQQLEGVDVVSVSCFVGAKQRAYWRSR